MTETRAAPVSSHAIARERDLGEIIRQMQASFVRSAEPHRVFDSLLPDLLRVSDSEYGFIGEVWREADGTPYLKIFTLSNIAWNAESRAMVERERPKGIEFRNLRTLFGVPLTTGQDVIANDAPNDPRSGGGMPPGHRPLRTFAGIPLFYGGELVGEIGLANRMPGYDGTLLAYLSPVFEAVAAIMGAVQLDRDRRKAELALVEGERRYRTTFEMAGVGIAHATLDGRFVEVNERYAQIVGRPPEALVGTRFQDITHPEDVGLGLGRAHALVRDASAPIQAEKRYLRPDGSVVWAHVTVALARGADHLILVANDITERKLAQEALIAAATAERANAAKTEFLSRMSHELRTPLNAVQGFAQLLRLDPREPLSEAQLQKVRHIERAGRHLLAMIDDVLDLSRIEAGTLSVRQEPLQLRRLAEEVLSLVAGMAREAEVQVTVDAGAVPPEPLVMADGVRLRQVLMNLVSNAVKYNRPGGSVNVGWRVLRRLDALRIDVQDTGRGLTPEQQRHLFEPFNRLGAERTGIEGTGIGLVITKRLVDLMHGRLAVQSSPSGSCFSVFMPLPGAEGMHVAAVTEPGELDAFVDPRPRTSRAVLYVEDNPSNVELVRQVFQLRPHWRLVVAKSGQEALVEARQLGRPDLLLLDMNLGDMTGLELAESLDHVPRLQGVPRVALSADAMPERRRAAQAAGFRAYLTKPIDVGALLRCLDEVLQ